MVQAEKAMTSSEVIQDAYQEVQRLIQASNRRSYPFRNRFNHTLRVLHWAQRIHPKEGGDWGIITLAVLFHDTGWDDDADHALLSAALAEAYLSERGFDPMLINRVSSAVSTHNKRDIPREKLPIENLIVMDADILDEVGVTTLVWDAMATANEDDPGYIKALDRNQKFFNGAVERAVSLKTETGRKLYMDRVNMWRKCLAHFRYELGLCESLHLEEQETGQV